QVARASKSAPFVLADPLFGESQTGYAANADAPRARRASSGGKRQSVTTGPDLSSVYFASLGGTAQEARAIKSLFPDAHVITGGEATESALKRVNAPRILHIATHGFFLQEAPSAATLVAANRGSTRS